MSLGHSDQWLLLFLCHVDPFSINTLSHFVQFSAQIGRLEDEEDIRREQQELARKRKKGGAGIRGGKQKKLKF